MSIRSDISKELSPALHTALSINGDHLAIASSQANAIQNGTAVAPSETQLAEANSFSTVNPDHPLQRTVTCHIRASLGDLAKSSKLACWKPTESAVRQIFQQQRLPFTPVKKSVPLFLMIED
jgi:hypothetical protein